MLANALASYVWPWLIDAWRILGPYGPWISMGVDG